MKRWIVWLIALALVFSMACSLTGGDKADTPTPAPTSVPTEAAEPEEEDTAIPEPTEAPEETPEETAEQPASETEEVEEEETEETDKEGSASGFQVDAGAFGELESYRSNLVMTFKSDDGATDGQMTVAQEATTNPPAQRVLLSMDGTFPGAEEMNEMAGGESFEIEVIVIDNNQWLRFGEMWLQTSADSENAVDADSLSDIQNTFLNPADLNDLGDEKELEYKGKEDINGLQTEHYYASYDSIWGKLGFEGGDIESGQANIWVANEPDLPQFIVKMDFEVVGKLDFGDEGEMVNGAMTFTLNVTDINQSFTIEVPEDAAAGGLPEDVPGYPNAQDQNVLGGMITFSTEDSEDDVNDFYLGAMEEAGWTLSEEGLLGNTWTKEDRELSMMVSSDEETGLTNVLMMINTEGE